MTPFQDGDYLRGDYSGRALKFKGKKVHHHSDCNVNMCDGWPTCRIADGHGGGWRIDYLHNRGRSHSCDDLCRSLTVLANDKVNE